MEAAISLPVLFSCVHFSLATEGEACHPVCESLCFGRLPNQCCHRECGDGCTGPLNTDCLRCRNFDDEGTCVVYCPPALIYDSKLMTVVKNPKRKYAHGNICVKQCPEGLLLSSGLCVSACPDGYYAKDFKNCESCGGPCPKVCRGTGRAHLTANILESFAGCTVINGNLKIVMASFNGDQRYNIAPLHPRNLTVLKDVREITGFLLIQSDHADFTDLSFLSSLEVIRGRQLDGGQVLHILGTPLKSLGLTSLKLIANGNVYILANPDLCYADSIDWKELLSPGSRQKSTVMMNKDLADCSRDKEVCDPQCSEAGCWDKGPKQCLKCLLYEYEDERLCLSNCTDHPLLYHAGDGKCKKCHAACASTCSGPRDTQCDSCAHASILTSDGETQCLDKSPTSPASPTGMNVDQNRKGVENGEKKKKKKKQKKEFIRLTVLVDSAQIRSQLLPLLGYPSRNPEKQEVDGKDDS